MRTVKPAASANGSDSSIRLTQIMLVAQAYRRFECNEDFAPTILCDINH